MLSTLVHYLPSYSYFSNRVIDTYLSQMWISLKMKALRLNFVLVYSWIQERKKDCLMMRRPIFIVLHVGYLAELQKRPFTNYHCFLNNYLLKEHLSTVSLPCTGLVLPSRVLASGGSQWSRVTKKSSGGWGCIPRFTVESIFVVSVFINHLNWNKLGPKQGATVWMTLTSVTF